MKIDIIGSKFASRLTEFRSFPYDVNIFVSGQSFLSLLSKPYPVSMKDINTSDIVEISTAHRDLNKANLSKLQESRSEVLMIDLLSELNELVKYNGSYFNKESFALITEEIEYEDLRKIDQFKALKQHLNKIIELTSFYKQVILLNVSPNNEHDDFINGIYELLYKHIENKLVISADISHIKDIFSAPIETYDTIVQQLRKFNSDNYENQLLFDEKLDGDTLSVYMNYIEPRHYVYELYKDGKPFKKSHQTDSRYCQFKLDEPAKYRVRVTPDTENVKPRFSQTYVYSHGNTNSNDSLPEYLEMPTKKNEWMLELLIERIKITGIVGNPYKYPEGYNGINVYQKVEMTSPFIQEQDLLEISLSLLENLTKEELLDFTEQHKQSLSQSSSGIKNYINFLKN